MGVNGVIINPVGLKNKIEQGKAGERAIEILQHPTPDNVVLALVYRVEHENFTDVLDLDKDKYSSNLVYLKSDVIVETG